MVPEVVLQLTALEAVAVANLFLSDHMPDRYCAGDPTYDHVARLWRVPVVMSYLRIGPIGEVGEIAVDGFSEEIVFHTPLDEMKARGRALYEQHQEAIETASIGKTSMIAQAVPKISALDAEAAASHFLFDHLPDRLTAGEPQFNARTGVWIVPVLLAYPRIGPVGQVGEIVISGQAKTVVSHTPVDDMLNNARAVYDQHRERIEAVVL